MIIFLSGEMLFLVLLLLIAGITWILDNLLWIILVAVIVNIVIPLILYKRPELFIGAVIVLIIVAVIALICMSINKKTEVNSTPVTISKATGDCVIIDESGDTIQISKGSIVAVFRHPEQQSAEHGFAGNSTICYWYDGIVRSTTVSTLHEIMNEPRNEWNLLEVDTITYKEFLDGKWLNYK